jgi:hypothetical protein
MEETRNGLHRKESVPEQERRESPEHDRYFELCALAAGGLLEGAECTEFRAHIEECSDCQTEYQAFSSLVSGDLQQARPAFGQKLAAMRVKPLPDSRERFLRRARAEGVVFSSQVEAPMPTRTWGLGSAGLLAPVTALALVTIGLAVYHFRSVPEAAQRDGGAAQQVGQLQQRNAALTSSLSESHDSLAAQEREIQNLRAQLQNAAATVENLRRNGQQSSAHTAQLLDESRNQEKLLAEAKDEAARNSQLRVDTEASLVEQQTRITELTNKLRIASATLDMERQLAATGKDVRELMAARDLHVIDVRDTDADGKPSEAFGRVFLTDGKSLSFYAFDLNEEHAGNAKRNYQVWAVADGKVSSRSLGSLHVDAKAPGRWVLKVDNPDLVKQISAVFVTSEPTAGAKEPSTQKMLYAYLGDANRP